MSLHRACCCKGDYWLLTPCECDDGDPNVWSRIYDPEMGCAWTEFEGACYTVCPDSQHKPSLDAEDILADTAFTPAQSHEDGCEQCCEPPIFDRCCGFMGVSECSAVDGPLPVAIDITIFVSGTAFYYQEPPPHCNISYSDSSRKIYRANRPYGFCYDDFGPDLYSLKRITTCDGSNMPGPVVKATVQHLLWGGDQTTDWCRYYEDDPYTDCFDSTVTGSLIELFCIMNSPWLFFGFQIKAIFGATGVGAFGSLTGLRYGSSEAFSVLAASAKLRVNKKMRGNCLHGASFTFVGHGHTRMIFVGNDPPYGTLHEEEEARVIVVMDFVAHGVGACPPGGGSPGRRRYLGAEDFLQ